jgi:hypothetical protein
MPLPFLMMNGTPDWGEVIATGQSDFETMLAQLGRIARRAKTTNTCFKGKCLGGEVVGTSGAESPPRVADGTREGLGAQVNNPLLKCSSFEAPRRVLLQPVPGIRDVVPSLGIDGMKRPTSAGGRAFAPRRAGAGLAENASVGRPEGRNQLNRARGSSGPTRHPVASSLGRPRPFRRGMPEHGRPIRTHRTAGP